MPRTSQVLNRSSLTATVEVNRRHCLHLQAACEQKRLTSLGLPLSPGEEEEFKICKLTLIPGGVVGTGFSCFFLKREWREDGRVLGLAVKDKHDLLLSRGIKVAKRQGRSCVLISSGLALWALLNSLC